MFSIASRHQEKARRRRLQQEAEGAQPVVNISVKTVKQRLQQPVLNSELEQDLTRLSDFESIDEKIAFKAEALIPKYRDSITAYCESGAQYVNTLLVYMIIWLIDVARVEEAIALADIAIEQRQPMPERFKRDLPTYAAEQIHAWAEQQYKQGNSASPYLEQVAERVDSKQWLITNIIVLNKLHKLRAMIAEDNEDYTIAVHFYGLCIKENPEKHGVKTRYEKVLKLAEQANATLSDSSNPTV